MVAGGRKGQLGFRSTIKPGVRFPRLEQYFLKQVAFVFRMMHIQTNDLKYDPFVGLNEIDKFLLFYDRHEGAYSAI